MRSAKGVGQVTKWGWWHVIEFNSLHLFWGTSLVPGNFVLGLKQLTDGIRKR